MWWQHDEHADYQKQPALNYYSAPVVSQAHWDLSLTTPFTVQWVVEGGHESTTAKLKLHKPSLQEIHDTG